MALVCVREKQRYGGREMGRERSVPAHTPAKGLPFFSSSPFLSFVLRPLHTLLRSVLTSLTPALHP